MRYDGQDSVRERLDQTYHPARAEVQPTFLESARRKVKPSATVTRPEESTGRVVTIDLTDDNEEEAVSKAQERIWSDVVVAEMARDYQSVRNDTKGGSDCETEDDHVKCPTKDSC